MRGSWSTNRQVGHDGSRYPSAGRSRRRGPDPRSPTCRMPLSDPPASLPPVFLALGALNAWTAHRRLRRPRHGTVSLCLRGRARRGPTATRLPSRSSGPRAHRDASRSRQPGTLPEALVLLNSSWPAASTDSPTAGSWCSSRTARLPLPGRTGWLPDRGQCAGLQAKPRGAARYIADDPRLPKPGIAAEH